MIFDPISRFIVAVVLGLCITIGPAQAAGRKTEVPKAESADEKAVIDLVRTVYRIPTRQYICYWEAEPLKGDFIKKFSPYFTHQIVDRFFKNHKDCNLVAEARYGGLPSDDPRKWDDHQIVLLRLHKPQINGSKAVMEVRFWSEHPPRGTDPLDHWHGGAIISLVVEGGRWRIANIESVDYLGALQFSSLIRDYPDRYDPPWRDADYRKSLIHPN